MSAYRLDTFQTIEVDAFQVMIRAHIPLLSMQSSRKHCSNLIEQKISRRRTARTGHNPVPGPFNPLTQIVRVEYQVKKTILGNHVDFINTFLL